MKKYLSIFAFALLLSSCSDTVVVKKVPDGSSTAPAVSGFFKKRVLIEDYTGTWCGNCPRVAYAIEQAMVQSDKVVPVAIHNGFDPYNYLGIGPLKDLISPNDALQLPQSRLNRTSTWTFPEPINLDEAFNLTGNNCGVGLAMNSAIANGTIDLNVKMKFAQDYSNIKLVVLLLENQLIHDQTNYTNYFGPGTTPTIANYVHNHVLRVSLTDIMGDAIAEPTTLGQTITKNYHLAIPSDITNAANMSFVAFIVDENNGAINARAALPNEIQDFEVNP
jgi:hypothetical protein